MYVDDPKCKTVHTFLSVDFPFKNCLPNDQVGIHANKAIVSEYSRKSPEFLCAPPRSSHPTSYGVNSNQSHFEARSISSSWCFRDCASSEPRDVEVARRILILDSCSSKLAGTSGKGVNRRDALGIAYHAPWWTATKIGKGMDPSSTARRK